jgi:hypothetical protein
MIHATRKVTRTNNGSATLTLTEFLGEDWEYVEINAEPGTAEKITVVISVLSKREVPRSPSAQTG